MSDRPNVQPKPVFGDCEMNTGVTGVINKYFEYQYQY